jgi:hypothetical protein
LPAISSYFSGLFIVVVKKQNKTISGVSTFVAAFVIVPWLWSVQDRAALLRDFPITNSWSHLMTVTHYL